MRVVLHGVLLVASSVGITLGCSRGITRLPSPAIASSDGLCPYSPDESLAARQTADAGATPIGDRARAHFLATSSAGERRGVVLLVRWARPAAPGAPTGRSMRGSGLQPIEAEEEGPVGYRLSFDPASGILRVGRGAVSVKEGNVVLLDRVDRVGGAPMLRVIGCIELGDEAESIRRATEIPEATRFLQ
jgi:hypothetical protein